jgi:spermidine synthase
VKGSAKFTFIVIAMAAGAGAASLVYLLVLAHDLALLFGGISPVTTAVTLTFLSGAAIGTWIGGLLADRRPRSSRIDFAALEFAAGLYGLASPWILRVIKSAQLALYPLIAGHTGLFAGIRFAWIGLVIFPPAILMGGSPPLLARPIASGTNGVIRGGGTVWSAAAFGAGLAAVAMICDGLPSLGFNSTILLVSAVGVLLGIAVFWAAIHLQNPAEPFTAGDSIFSRATRRPFHGLVNFLILINFAASGFALAAFQVAWGRLLVMVTGPSIWLCGAFIVVPLTALGIGILLYERRGRTTEGHRRSVTRLTFLIAFTAALSMICLPRFPYLFAHCFPLLRNSFGWRLTTYFVATAIVASLPWGLFGAMFSGVIGSSQVVPARFGSAIGIAYLAGTMGIVAGAGLAEFVLIAAVGLHATMDIGALTAITVGFALWWHMRVPSFRVQALMLAPAAAALLLGILPHWPREAFAAGVGFSAPRWRAGQTFGEIVNGMRLLYYRDGKSATISVDERGQDLFLRSDGKTQASTDPVDVADQLLLGHLPMLLHPAPRDVLMLGLDTGMTEAAVARYAVQRIDIIEPEPMAVEAARFFNSYTRKVLDDSRVHVIIGNARNRLLLSPEQYDVVVAEPSDVWAIGAGSSSTLEFYGMVKARLKPGGIFVQDIHTQALLPDDLRLLAATFHAVFRHMEIWTSGPGNLLLLGTRDPVSWDYRRLQQHFARTLGVADDLKSIGIWQPFALFGAQVLGESGSDAFTSGIGTLNTDDYPVLEFHILRSLYSETTANIAKELNPFRRPDAPPIVGFDPQRDLDADGAYLLGFAYASMGQHDLAIRYMERSTAMAPNRPMFFVGLGNQYRATGRISEARGVYERALSLDLNNVEALLSLGEIRLDEGQWKWARVLADRALRLAPQNARVHALIGRLQEMGHWR